MERWQVCEYANDEQISRKVFNTYEGAMAHFQKRNDENRSKYIGSVLSVTRTDETNRARRILSETQGSQSESDS